MIMEIFKQLNIPKIKWYHYLIFPFYKIYKGTDGDYNIFCKKIKGVLYIFKEQYKQS